MGLERGDREVKILDAKTSRSLQFKGLGVARTHGRTPHHVVFGSLESEAMNVYLGVWGGTKGTLACRRSKSEEAALLNVLRRPARRASSRERTASGSGERRPSWRSPRALGTIDPMRAFMLEVPESLLEERRRTGADRWDEVWDGVLHMVPAPSQWHQEFAGNLYDVVKPIARKLGFKTSYETSIYRPSVEKQDYRTPDIAIYLPKYVSKRGVEGVAALAIEVLSPNDETYEKLPFYVDAGVKEIVVVDPDTRTVELFVAEGGRPAKVAPGADGGVRSAALGVTFTPVVGPRLRLSWAGDAAEI